MLIGVFNYWQIYRNQMSGAEMGKWLSSSSIKAALSCPAGSPERGGGLTGIPGVQCPPVTDTEPWAKLFAETCSDLVCQLVWKFWSRVKAGPLVGLVST